jgi:putative transposase
MSGMSRRKRKASGEAVIELSHKIELVPTAEQEAYFRKACGTARFTWNWALAEWNRQFTAGEKPTAYSLKKAFNMIKYKQYPWLEGVHRDAHAEPFSNLGKAWARFFKDIKEGIPTHAPRFKKKGRSRDSFYVANDKFSMKEKIIRLPIVGEVRMREALRFEGKLLGAAVSRCADRWFVSVQVEIPEHKAKRKRTGDGIEGVDLGLKAAVVLSDGCTIESPCPLKKMLRRLKIRGRSISRKLEAARTAIGLKSSEAIPKGTRLPISNNRRKASDRVASLHYRVSNVRADWLHKTTTRLCRENQAIGIEDLNVKGMLRNEKLARAISDVGFGEFRRQMQYKARLYDTGLVVADRWFPSSKECSECGYVMEVLPLSVRQWTCPICGTVHDRDTNAARNLKRLATVTALPVASTSAMRCTDVAYAVSGGKVTPVSHEFRLQEVSGQEEGCAHFCAQLE